MNTNNYGGTVGPRGTLHAGVTRDLGALRIEKAPFGWHVRNWLGYRRRDLPKLIAMGLLGHLPGVVTMEARLRGQVYRRPSDLPLWQLAKLRRLLDANEPLEAIARAFGGSILDYGTLSTRVVTTAGAGFIVDAFQNLVELELMKYHGFGTGTTAEASADTALVTELTTQYATDNTRPTGSQTEASALVYRTVGTLSPDASCAITEHGIFSATSAGTLLDRSVFSAVNLTSADSLQATYDLTVSAGG